MPKQSSTPPTDYAKRTLRALAIMGGIAGAAWLIGTPPGILGKADAVGYAICHRIAERSFHAHDHQMPLCARCTGIYLGVFIGLMAFILAGRLRAAKLPNAKVLIAIAAPITFYGFDGLNSYFSIFEFYRPIYQPHNTLRLLTGTTFGLAMITIVVPVFNMIAWEQREDTGALAPLKTLREWAALYAVAGLACLLVLWQQPAILYAVSVISALMVLMLFSVIGMVMFLTLSERENTLTHWHELIIPAAAGLTFAIIMIGTIDLARYLFTGTWDGFVLAG